MKYDDLISKLEIEFADGSVPAVTNLVEGECYVASVDKSPQRARLEKIISANQVRVFLLDEGETETLPRNDIFELRDEYLQLPPQAREFSLNGIATFPCDPVVLERIMAPHVMRKTFVMEIIKEYENKSGPCALVNLWDTSTDSDRKVNTEIMEELLKLLEPPVSYLTVVSTINKFQKIAFVCVFLVIYPNIILDVRCGFLIVIRGILVLFLLTKCM